MSDGLRARRTPVRPSTRLRPVLSLLGAVLWMVSASPSRLQERAEGSDFIRVTEEPWKIGEIRTYTLLLDQAPFGRETIRLDDIQGKGEGRSLRFAQTLALDLRAIGQEGALLSYSTIRYERGRIARAYRTENLVRERSGYSTYQKAGARDQRQLVSLDLATHPPRMTLSGGEIDVEIPLPPAEGAAVVDPLSMGHWERLFLGDAWRLGESRAVDLLLPAGLFRFDYHLTTGALSAPVPKRIRATVRVEAKEMVEVFSVPIPAFRCRIPELGYTLWVTESGGILRFEDGRGLVVCLER